MRLAVCIQQFVRDANTSPLAAPHTVAAFGEAHLLFACAGLPAATAWLTRIGVLPPASSTPLTRSTLPIEVAHTTAFMHRLFIHFCGRRS